MRFFLSSFVRALSKSILLGVAAVLLACGSGEAQQTEEMDATDSASPDTSTTVVEVTMTDHAYDPSSITVPAGKPVTLQFENTGSVEHYFVVGDTMTSEGGGFEKNLFSGVSIEKNKQTEGRDEEDEHAGEEKDHHENEFELPPGGKGSMTFTLPPSKAGTYTIACFETTGGKKHHEMGMTGTLTVTAANGNE